MLHASHIRISLWILPLFAAASCGQDSIPNRPVRQRGVQFVGGPVPPPKREELPAEAPLDPITSPEPPPEERPSDKPGEVLAAQNAVPEDEKPPRDLKNELETMIGSPVKCLAPRTAKEAPSQVTISLSASVMPSGAVGRGEVSAPGLSGDELKCVRSKLESLRFTQPIENAPLTVSGAITLNRGS